MIAFRVRVVEGDGHHSLSIFAGPDFEHLALTGILRMRPDEAAEFTDKMATGQQVQIVRDGDAE